MFPTRLIHLIETHADELSDGAPYLLDYVMPVLYAILIALSRRALGWVQPGISKVGRLEGMAVIALQVLAAWRTTSLNKWGWITGGHWR